MGKDVNIMSIKTFHKYLFFFASLLNTVVIGLLGINYGTYALFGLIVLLYALKNITAQQFLIYCLFIPNKYLQMVGVVIFLFLSGSLIFPKIKNSVFFFLIYILVIGSLSSIINNGLILGTLFQTAVYYCIFQLIVSFRNKINIHDACFQLESLAFLQYIAVIIQFALTRKTMDTLTGTLISAHYLGVFLVVYIYILLFGPIKQDGRKIIFHLIAAMACLWFSDAKHIWIFFIICVLLYKILERLHIKRPILITGICLMVFIPLIIYIVSIPSVADVLKRNNVFRMYIYSSSYNKKYVIFSRMYEQLKSVFGVFGFGVGQFGSQISITLSKGIIYDWNPAIQGFHYAIPQYAECVKGLMTEWYTKTGLPLSSMVLGYPLVSYVGLLGELGVIGYIWLLTIFEKLFKGQEKVFIVYFLVLTIFDIYFEIPCVLVMLLFATTIATNNKVKKRLMRLRLYT